MKKFYAIIGVLCVVLTIGAVTLDLETVSECRARCDLQHPVDIFARTLCYNSCYDPGPHYTEAFCRFYCRNAISDLCFDECMDGVLINL